MNHKLLVDTAILAGKIMLCNGAETYRVEDTMSRILKISGLEKVEAFTFSTGIMVTLDDPSIDAITVIERVTTRVTRLDRIYYVNNISRNLCKGNISVEDAYCELKKVKNVKTYSDTLIYICTILTTIFFTVLLGGELKDCIVSFINGIILVLCILISEKIELNGFVKNMIASFLMALNTMFFLTFLDISNQQEIIITASIMPLVPGVAITNAIRDTMQGDYVSGGSGVIEAFVAAASIAVGIGAGLSLFAFLLGGI